MPFKVFVAGSTATVADVNTYLMQQAVIVCSSGTRPGSPIEGMTIYETDTDRLLTYGGAQWWTPKLMDGATVATSETTGSTSFTDLTTAGPAVTLPTGTRALVIVTAALSNSTVGAYALMGFAVSGATTRAALDSESLQEIPTTASTPPRMSASFFVTGLTAGTNTFTAKYKASAGTAAFADRTIIVIGQP